MKCLILALLSLPLSVFAQVQPFERPVGNEKSADALQELTQVNNEIKPIRGLYKKVQLSGFDRKNGTECSSSGDRLVVVLKVEADHLFTYEKTHLIKRRPVAGDCQEIAGESTVVRKSKIQSISDLYFDLASYGSVAIYQNGDHLAFFSDTDLNESSKSQSLFEIEKLTELSTFTGLKRIAFFDSSANQISAESQEITSHGSGYDVASLAPQLLKIDFIGLQRSENRAGVNLVELLN